MGGVLRGITFILLDDPISPTLEELRFQREAWLRDWWEVKVEEERAERGKGGVGLGWKDGVVRQAEVPPGVPPPSSHQVVRRSRL